MRPKLANVALTDLRSMLAGEPEFLRFWIEARGWEKLVPGVGVILVGAGAYGAAMGCWRAPLQGMFVAIKLPLIVFMTSLGNSLLNAMLAPLLGLNISFRQSCAAILMSFTIACAILGSFSPLAAFMVWNAPPMTHDVQVSGGVYSLIQLTHVGVIALAGIVANLRLVQLLSQLSGSKRIAHRILIAWLAGNLFLGSQLSWLLRPFIGAPGLPIEFLRASAFKGNFYESVFHSLLRVLDVK
jgi:hypothetical protein